MSGAMTIDPTVTTTATAIATAIATETATAKVESAAEATAPVPERYRGVWRRTLLQTPDRHDTTTTVLWLQTARWHADIRIPAQRPDFSGATTLATCTPAQRAWLTRQQGFAGTTEVTATAEGDVCAWHRLVDFQPPAAGPDAGFMHFEPERLVETGVHGVYLEHWIAEPRSTQGHAVFQRIDAAGHGAMPLELLMVSGDCVMHVRSRAGAWPQEIRPGMDFAEVAAGMQAALLDFEISYGHRTAHGWRIAHSTLPWREGLSIALEIDRSSDDRATLTWDGVPSSWRVLEWAPPAATAHLQR
jgi:hypothetical protein